MKKIVNYFVQGLVTAMPLFLTLYIFIILFQKVGSVLNKLGIRIHPFVDPIIGVVGVLCVIVLIGMLASSFLFQSILIVMNKLLERNSVVKTVYHSIKDFVNAFIGNKKKFDKPVLIILNKETGTKQMGFITQTDLSNLSLPNTHSAVYMPFSYGFNGQLLIVPNENITPVDAKSSEVMKFIVSGGVVTEHDENEN